MDQPIFAAVAGEDHVLAVASTRGEAVVAAERRFRSLYHIPGVVDAVGPEGFDVCLSVVRVDPGAVPFVNEALLWCGAVNDMPYDSYRGILVFAELKASMKLARQRGRLAASEAMVLLSPRCVLEEVH